MADEFELSRRQFGSTALANFLAGWMSTVAPSLRAQEPANDEQSLPAQPKPDHHLPADYRELFKLSAEQKVLISALVASGGDAGADGKPLVNHDSIDPDALCFLISNGVFHAYGEQRVAEANGWASKRKGEFEGKSKYHSEELTKVEAEILKTFGWDKAEVREQKEKEIRASIAADPILLDKGQQAEQGAGVKVLGR